jgi:predicted phage terminase large subunit-like protein
LRVCRYWDKAATDEAEGGDPDWTAGVLMAEKSGIYYILDIIRVRKSSGDVEDLIKATAYADGRGVVIFMEEEGGSAGKDVSRYYARNVLRGFAFKPVRSTGSKVVRAAPLSSAAQQGLVKIWAPPGRPIPWLRDYFEELELFPVGAHDDQVDATAGAFAQLAQWTNLGWPGIDAGAPEFTKTIPKISHMMRDDDDEDVRTIPRM